MGKHFLGFLFFFYTLFSVCYAVLIAYVPNFGVDTYGFVTQYSQVLRENYYYYYFVLFSFLLGYVLSYFFLYLNKSSRIISGERNYFYSNGFDIGYLTVFFLVLLSVSSMYLVFQESFFVRDTYHSILHSRTFYMELSKIIFLMSIALIYLSRKIYFLCKWFLIVFLIVLSLNYSSRFSGAYVGVIICLDVFLFKKTSMIRFFLLCVFCFLVVALAGYFRGLESQGIFNYLLLFDFCEFLKLLKFTIYYTTAFSVFVTMGTITSYTLEYNQLITMLNPMLGIFTDWYSFSGEMIVVPNVPYSGVGILISSGLFLCCIYFFLVGFFFSVVDFVIFYHLNRRPLLTVVLFSLCAVFIILINQYNLRAATRYLYYAVFFIVLYFSLKLFNYRSRRRISTIL